jgi:hypothetical protein
MNSLSIRSFRTLAAALALTLSVAVPAMHAQYSPSPDIAVVTVPFAFEAGSSHFAAGRYTLTALNSNLLQVRDGSNSGLLMSRGEIDNKPSSKSVAVFHKSADKYFLAEIHTKGTEKYIACIKTSAEAKARKTNMALNHTTGTSIEVATVEAPR